MPSINFELQNIAHSTLSFRLHFAGLLDWGSIFGLRAQVRSTMVRALSRLWEDEAQDVAEYAVMLAVILAVVVGTIRLIGSNANNVFSSVSSSIQ